MDFSHKHLLYNIHKYNKFLQNVDIFVHTFVSFFTIEEPHQSIF